NDAVGWSKFAARFCAKPYWLRTGPDTVTIPVPSRTPARDKTSLRFVVRLEVLRLVVQDDVQQRAVDFDTAVVFDEAQFAELVHEEIHPRSRGADHLRKGLLAD